MKHTSTHKYSNIDFSRFKVLKRFLLGALLCVTTSLFAQIGSQSPSVQSGVSFQWNDIQDINFNGDTDGTENNRPASIRSIIINDGTETTVFDKFAVPTFYQLTRLGDGGNANVNSRNHLWENGVQIVSSSATATLNVNDNNLWDTSALAAFQDKNLNHYFEANPVGRNICGDFDEANGTNGVTETDAQLQTIFYDPAMPSNAGGILAVTERGGNNCYYVRMIGIPVGGGAEQVLGDTFVRNAGGGFWNAGFMPPLPNSDYWSSGREYDNSQDIAIALFQLNDVAPTGSLITRIEFVAATRDHGDGKFFILQRYAEDLEKFGCEDTIFNGDIAEENNVPDTSVYSVESAPSPAGAVQSFNLNADGTYTLVPTPGFVGVISFDYGVCLPAPNEVICDTATITVEFYPTPDDAVVEISCPGNSNATQINVVSPLGSQYEYSLDNGSFQDTTVFSNLTSGTHNVSVKNVNTGCVSDVSIDISFVNVELEALTQIDCFGENTGDINVNVTGGNLPYTYLWSNGATTQDLTNVVAGTYSITVTDAGGCKDTSSYTLTQPSSAVSATSVVQDVDCFGSATGSINLTPAGGTSPYTYLWSNNATTQDISGLTAGDYTVVITDAKDCEFTQTITVNGPATGLSQTNVVTDVACFGENTGAINLTVVGGTANYTYSWSNGATSQDLSGVAAGSYTVVITDANDCTLSATIVIDGPASALMQTNTVTDVSCFGENTGAINLTPNGGTSGYTYSWSNGASTQDLSGVAAGSYTVTITDANDCTLVETIVVGGPAAALSLTNSVTDVTCFGESTGAINITPSGGTPGYTYSWSNGATTQDISGVTAGSYTVTVTDTNDCELSETIIIDEPTAALNLTFTKVDVLCNGDNSGSINITVNGGTSGYTYSWSNGASTEDLINVPAGSYSVEVTDANDCTFTQSGINIVEPASAIGIVITKTNATTAQGCADGTATATASGGTAGYTYQWGASAANQTGATASNLATGNHTVTVTDANGCTMEQTVVIDCSNTCDQVIAVNSVTNVLCKDDETGASTVTATSVANPGALYTFVWNTTPVQTDAGVTSSTISGQGAGVYTVSVTIDGTQCLPVEQSVTITEPSSALDVSASSTDESGPTTNDGTATANVSGGTSGYSYSWAPGGATTQTITGLDEGTYTVTVTDANGCIETATTTVNPGTCLNLAVTATPSGVTCNGDGDGSVDAAVTGGSGNFTYSWSNAATSEDLTGLAGGAYTITVTDTVTLCTATATATVIEPNALSSGIAVNSVLCFGESTGSLNLTVSGGTAPYEFVWSNAATTEDISAIPAGTYSVTITDANGCTLTDSAIVLEPTAALTAQVDSQVDSVCGADGTVTITAQGGTSSYTYSLDGGTAQSNGAFADVSSGEHTVVVTDANGCTYDVAVEILINCTDAIDDINDTFVNAEVDGNVLTNDEDAEGNIQMVTSNTQPSNGSVVVDPSGSYTYIPATDFVGTDMFTYTICDDGTPQACDTANVVIEVSDIPSNSENNPPVANNDTATTDVDEPVIIAVLPNDFDPDGDTVTVTPGSVTDPTNGTLVVNPNGTITYTPDTGFVGEDTFTYEICDNGTPSLCDTATVTVTVNPENDTNETVANDDAYNGGQDEPISGNVLDNDTDPEGDDQTVNTTPVVGPENGTLLLNEDGTFDYTPDPDFVGTDSFVYSVCDDGTPEACDEATVILTVNPGNTTDAIDDINDTFINVAVDGNVLTNDEDAEGNTQVVTSNTQPSNGTVTVNPNGTYTYEPATDFVGTDMFTYTICDDGTPQACDTANVVIEVSDIPSNSENNPPVANNDTATTDLDEPVVISVLPNDFDPDGDTVTVTPGSATDPTNGTVVINPNGTITYTPDTGFVGEDTFTYEICDNGTPSLCDTATVTVTVNPENDTNETVANDDAYNGDQDEPITGNVSDNDTDPEGDDQTVNETPVVDPTNGTVVLNENGTFEYTPNPGFVGTDSFVYSVCDDGTPEACDEATVILTVNPVNTTDAIDDINDTFINVAVDGNVLTNDEDAEGNTQVVTSNTQPSNGTVTVNPNGTYTYEPATDFVGTDMFTYTICDNGTPQACDTANVVIEVSDLPSNSENNPPVANNDTATTDVDEPVVVSVLPNDFDPDGDTVTVTPGSATDPTNGTVVINPNGTITYTPDAGFVGEDTFTYEICDNGTPSLCDTATVTVTVNPENDINETVANDDAYNGDQDEPITGNVSDNDTDPEGDDQTVNETPVVDPTNGTVVLNEDGTFEYTPNPGFVGTDSFVYSVCDNGTPEACDEATVILTINPVNTTDAIDDINNTFINVAVDGNVLINDEDAEGNTQVVTSNTQPSNGTVTVNPNGTYTYEPATDFVGTDMFTYTICDDGTPEACDTANVVIEILPISGPDNEAPIANNDTSTTDAGEPVDIVVLSNDFDPDMDPITVTPGSATDPENGEVVINPDGTITYTPDEDFIGEDTFTYEICDNGTPALCDTATVTITVNPDNNVNETVANDDAYNGIQDTPITGNVSDNDTDPEDDDQTVNETPVVEPTNGTVVLNDNGTFEYTPDPEFIGTDSFVYSVCDNGTPQACDEATVYITVGEKLIPDFSPTIFTGNTTIIGDSGSVDFRVFVAEYVDQNSNGITPVELRIIKNDDFIITYDPALSSLNGVPVSNSDWLYDGSNPSLHRFTYVGNGGIFKASTASNIGINAVYNPPSNTNGTFPLKVTIKYFSGGEVNNDNNDDLDYIEFTNN